MLAVELDEINGIATLEPGGALSEEDFKLAAKTIDPYIEKAESLKGLIIHVEHFPSWESFAALVSHLKFIKEHHTHISRLAFATDSVLGNFAQTIASHFVSAEMKVFSYQEIELAKQWLKLP